MVDPDDDRHLNPDDLRFFKRQLKQSYRMGRGWLARLRRLLLTVQTGEFIAWSEIKPPRWIRSLFMW